MSVEVLTVSSKGQVVLPVDMRKELSIEYGDKLAAYASDGVIMLKRIEIPTEKDFMAKMDEAQEWAQTVGMTEDDITEAIKAVRKSRGKTK